MTLRSMTKKQWERHVAGMIYTKSEPPVRVERLVRRAASRTLKRLKEETVLGPIGPICIEEWRCCVDIIAEEMSKLPNTR